MAASKLSFEQTLCIGKYFWINENNRYLIAIISISEDALAGENSYIAQYIITTLALQQYYSDDKIQNDRSNNLPLFKNLDGYSTEKADILVL